MVKRMDEKKDQPKKVSTCFEGPACAEMMEKVPGEEGIGSLCDEMMRSWVKRSCEDRAEPQAAKKKKSTKIKITGGVK